MFRMEECSYLVFRMRCIMEELASVPPLKGEAGAPVPPPPGPPLRRVAAVPP